MWLDSLKNMKAASGLTTKEIAAGAGVPEPTLEKIFAGVTKDIRLDTARRLVHFFGFTLDDLDGGKVTPFPVKATEYAKEEKTLIHRYRTLDTYGKEAVDAVLGVEYRRMTKLADPKHEGWTTYIKYFDLAVSAGTGEPWMDAAHATRLAIPTEKVPEKANFCVRVNGSSMEPAYKDGDIVFVQHVEDGELREGEIGVFLLNGEGYIKRLGEGTLISLNTEYEPITLHDYDSFRCQGRVLGKL